MNTRNEDNIAPRTPYQFVEVGGYLAVSFPVLFCIGVAVMLLPVTLGWCEWWWTLVVGFLFMAVGGGGVWFWLLRDRNRLLWAERVTGIDINRDGSVGEPRLVYVRGVREARRHGDIEEAERFRLFLQGVYGDRGPTWRAWEGALTQEQWQDYCGRLLEANLAERKGETSPLTLTSSYRDALVAFREMWQ
jgi:hypothetical protein